MSSYLPTPQGLGPCPFCLGDDGDHGAPRRALGFIAASLVEHVERDHHVPIAFPLENTIDAVRRFRNAYPDAGNPELCRCPICADRRGDRAGAA